MKVELELTRKSVVKMVLVVVAMFGIAFAGFTAGVSVTYPVAHKKGVEDGFVTIQDLLAEKDINLTWYNMGNGQYKIEIYSLSSGKLQHALISEFHLLVQHFDKYGKLLSETYHAMTTTNLGKDWVEEQLFNNCNVSRLALYLGCSNSSDSVSTAWTELPGEITTDGLSRALGAYQDTQDGSDIGACNVTKTFGVTGTNSTKLYGVYYQAYAEPTLVAAEQQGVGNQKNVNSGDSLKLTVQWSVSDA